MAPLRPERPWPHTGAVLAGGRSRRMGRPKQALALPDGTTLIEAVVGALRQVCVRVVVVGDLEMGLPNVVDLRPGQGPLGGIEALLGSGLDSQYLVCPCDVPLVTASLLERLALPAAERATVFHVAGEGAFRPLPARLPAGALDMVREHLERGQRAVHVLVRALRPQLVPISAGEARQLADVNTPQEYEALRRG